MPNVFQNNFFYTREAAPPKKLELEPFSVEPELCQLGLFSDSHHVKFGALHAHEIRSIPSVREIVVTDL